MTLTERAKTLAVGAGIGFAIFIGSIRVAWWLVRGTPYSRDRRYWRKAN